MKETMELKNTYANTFKTEDLKMRETEIEKTKTTVTAYLIKYLVPLRYGQGRYRLGVLLEVQIREQVVHSQKGERGCKGCPWSLHHYGLTNRMERDLR